MSRKPAVAVKAVVTLDTKPISQQMDGIRRAIESGLVDVQTITSFKRLLAPPKAPAIHLTKSTKSASLASTRGKKAATSAGAVETFPSGEWVSATKTIVMKCVTALATQIESRGEKDGKVEQGTRNIVLCCKLALEALRQKEAHVDVGVNWVNKGYCGYIAKLVALEMVLKFITAPQKEKGGN
jgi:hypothetical protein